MKKILILFMCLCLFPIIIIAKDYTDPLGTSCLLPNSWAIHNTYGDVYKDAYSLTEIYGDFISIFLYTFPNNTNSSEVMNLSLKDRQYIANDLMSLSSSKFSSVISQKNSLAFLNNLSAIKVFIDGYRNGYLLSLEEYLIFKNNKKVLIMIYSPAYRPTVIQAQISKFLNSLSISSTVKAATANGK